MGANPHYDISDPGHLDRHGSTPEDLPPLQPLLGYLQQWKCFWSSGTPGQCPTRFPLGRRETMHLSETALRRRRLGQTSRQRF
jgi:hypothetical protein